MDAALQFGKAKIARAIDVGYGNTKFIALRQSQAVHCGLFPSIAPQASASADLGEGVLQRRNTCNVLVNGVRYEVGKDARLAQDISYGRSLNPGFALTDPYIALVRGAIYYMGVDSIDVLTVGLPVNTVDATRKELEKLLVGEHQIPRPRGRDGNADERIVRVEQVMVLPQPIGAFFDYSLQAGRYEVMRNQMNLVIDPGYFTLDWVVAHGTKIANARSSAHNGGMSAVLSTMAEAISRDLGTQITDLSRLDDALRLKEPPRFFGKEFDLTKYLPLAKAKAREFVAELANKVRDAEDIDNIIMAGGGAEFFLDIVREQFPHHEIVITPDPVFANVRGFQFFGERLLQTMASAAA